MPQNFYLESAYNPDANCGLIHIMPKPPTEILDEIKCKAEVIIETYAILNDEDQEWKIAVFIPLAIREDVFAFSALAKEFFKLHGHSTTETFVDNFDD